MKRNPEFDSLYAKYFDESEIKSEVDWSVIFNRFKKLDNLITR